ncbi:MAG: hypothetical protein HF314_03660 [Ignavibacteria bacterium]|jgi:hypothetical protein|nr:hypothetical protein [Ignavibacteria bacterium]MCU7502148.1 hypothetical protein [Ignavibacteria bacterium]MCU7515550.1 hypothetical protein [Ignavibacteria bacterium]
MKKVILVFFLLSACTYAQRETVFEGDIENGGFGGPVVKFTEVKKSFGVIVGGYGGWLINHQFLVGGGGFGLANDILADEEVTDIFGFTERPRLNFGYGGLILEYYHDPMKLVHFSFSLLVGGGGVSYREGIFMEHSSRDNTPDAFFVLEPAVSGELNVAKFFKVGLGAGYRWASGINMPGVKNSDFSNFSINLALKFGKF